MKIYCVYEDENKARTERFFFSLEKANNFYLNRKYSMLWSIDDFETEDEIETED